MEAVDSVHQGTSRTQAQSQAEKQGQEVRSLELLNQAQLAAQAGDMHKVWTVVKSLAPETKKEITAIAQAGAHHVARGRTRLTRLGH